MQKLGPFVLHPANREVEVIKHGKGNLYRGEVCKKNVRHGFGGMIAADG